MAKCLRQDTAAEGRTATMVQYFFNTCKLPYVLTAVAVVWSAHIALYAQEHAINNPGFFPAEKSLALGKAAYEDGAYAAAKRHLDAAIYRKKKYPEALFFRALTKEHLQDSLGALTDYNALIYLEPEHAEALYSRGILRYAFGQYSFARKDFQAALRLPVQETHTVYYKTLPDAGGTIGISTLHTMQSEILNYIGLCYLGEEKFAAAVAFYDSVLMHCAPVPDFLVNRGKAHEKNGNLTHAADDYRRAITLDPRNETARFNLSKIYSITGEPDKAIDALSQLMANNSASVMMLTQRGLYHYEDGNYVAALSDFDSAITLSMPDPELYYNRGLTFMKTGNTGLAIADFGRSLQIDPQFAKAYQARGAVFIREKQYSKAIYDLDLAIHYADAYGIAYYNRAVANLYLHRYSEGCKDLRRALDLGVSQAADLIDDVCANEPTHQDGP
jgi:tetratricopeptide (TPR) repeat protein